MSLPNPESLSGQKKIPCPTCGALISMDDDVCPNCGLQFGGGPETPRPASVGHFLDSALEIISPLKKTRKSKSGKKKKGEEKLLSFDEVQENLKIKSQHYLGVKPIRLTDIIGSLGRYNDFNRHFLPVEGFTTKKLAPMIELLKSGAEVPPIQVYEVDGKYLVIDGHHRVAASLFLGDREMIDAEITRLEVEAPIDRPVEYRAESEALVSLIIDLEHKSFQKKTYLYNNILVFPIVATNISAYGKLYEDILAQHAFTQKKSPETSLVVTALEWYRHRFLPVVKLIRDYKLLEKFGDRTLTDLYVWLLMHRAFLSQATGQEMGFNSAIRDFLNLTGKKAYFDNLPLRFESYLRYILDHRAGK